MTDAAEADTLEVGPCPACRRKNPPDARFCSGCGRQLRSAGETKGDQGLEGVADPLVGRVIADRYKIVSLLGRGGMGVVYKAEHVHIAKLMAIKLLHGELSRDKETIKRFRREAETASKLSHPNSVQIFDFGHAEGLVYLVMEYVEGRDLGQIIHHGGALPFARAARICAQVCASVAEAHALGVVHRDLKPENVMISEARQPDFAKVLDFGLAKLREEGRGHITLTQAGRIVGTPYYMSPEQIRGEEEVDGRGDVYAIGAMLYKTCTGMPPYSASTPMGVLTKHLTEPLVPPSQRVASALPPEADEIIATAMEKDAAHRYQRAEDLRRALVEALVAAGEDPGPATLGAESGGQASPPSSKRASRGAATRGEVDAYERKLRRRGLLGYVVVTLLVAGSVAGGWMAWRSHASRVTPTAEREPNNVPEQANALPPATAVEGFIGKRLDLGRSDADVYRLRNPADERRAIEFRVGAIPNIDLVVELVREGSSTPVLEADTGDVGEPERVPNFPLVGRTYYLRVREVWSERIPTENISDPYEVEWRLVRTDPHDEREINDSLELAGDLAVGAQRRGYIGWAGDVDHYCLTAVPPAGTVVGLDGVPGVDLTLRVVRDGVIGQSALIDAGGLGENERHVFSDSHVSGRAAEEGSERPQTCLAVAAAEGHGAPADAETPYVLRVVPEEPE